jgi:preprotein translocase subunit SecA
MLRDDQDDEVYRTNVEKYAAIIALLEECKQKGQPVLVGTTSIEKSESLAEMLRQKGWEQHDFTDSNAFAALYSGDEGAKKKKVFAILNARYHEQEAYIVSQAGVPGAITIATNMAGRGTDIQLGGNADMRIRQELADVPEGPARDEAIAKIKAQVERLKETALQAGGLFVLGTERHESRRIDNQLRGRSGRQGDPGRSKFFLSLEDDLMRIFGSDKLDGMLTKLGLKEGEAIIHPWINKALEKAQQKVEARNFDIRKNILKFDNVMNDQRKVIFDQRVELMKDETVAETITDMRHDVVEELVAKHVPENAYPEQWDVVGLKEDVKRLLDLDLPVDEWAKEEGIADEELLQRIERRADERMAAKVAQWGPDVLRYVEKSILLQTLDHLWREHLVMLEHLRQVIGLRGYGQRDPLNEYKAEAFSLFEAMTSNLREAVTSQLMRVEIVQAPPEQTPDLPPMQAHHANPVTGEDELALAEAGGRTLQRAGITPAPASTVAAAERNPADQNSWGKVGRNEPCPCGSGKKFKHCHGRYA